MDRAHGVLAGDGATVDAIQLFGEQVIPELKRSNASVSTAIVRCQFSREFALNLPRGC